jgi:hypothetical protein
VLVDPGKVSTNWRLHWGSEDLAILTDLSNSDPGAMVPFPSSPEPIVTISPIQAASGRSGGNTSGAQDIPFMVPFETSVGYGYAPNPQVNSCLQHHTSGSYTQPNMMK